MDVSLWWIPRVKHLHIPVEDMKREALAEEKIIRKYHLKALFDSAHTERKKKKYMTATNALLHPFTKKKKCRLEEDPPCRTFEWCAHEPRVNLWILEQ